MKLVGFLGVLIGIAGVSWVTLIGFLDMNHFGSGTSEYHNGVLYVKYGIAFILIFLVTMRLMVKQYWKLCVLIGLLCTLFSVLGLFSIGLYFIWGSLFIFVYSLVQIMLKERRPR